MGPSGAAQRDPFEPLPTPASGPSTTTTTPIWTFLASPRSAASLAIVCSTEQILADFGKMPHVVGACDFRSRRCSQVLRGKEIRRVKTPKCRA